MKNEKGKEKKYTFEISCLVALNAGKQIDRI